MQPTISRFFKPVKGQKEKSDPILVDAQSTKELGTPLEQASVDLDNDDAEILVVEETENSVQPKPKKRKLTTGKLTPLDQQVKELKAANNDKILVVRVGYKYKCFAEDAIKASKILHIMLVPGKLSFDESHPQDIEHKQYAYCSFPDTRLNVHLERLVHHNLRVGVVEQVETSAIKKLSATGSKNTVFERKVTNTFSKATFGINNTFDSNSPHILGDANTIWAIDARLSGKTCHYAIVSTNLNSGEIIYDEFDDRINRTNALQTRIDHLQPAEIVSSQVLPKYLTVLFQNYSCMATVKEDYYSADISDALSYIFEDKNFSDGVQQMTMLLYSYLVPYNNEKLLLLNSNYKPFSAGSHMILNSNTIQSLDLFSNDGGKGSLFWIIDHTRTPFGSRQLREWLLRPSCSKKEIENRLDAADCLRACVSDIFFESLNQMLQNSSDMARTLNRISYGSTSRKEVYFFLKQIVTFSNHFKAHSRYIEAEVCQEEGKIKSKSSLLSNIFDELNELFKIETISNLLYMINVSAVMEKEEEQQITGFLNLNNYDNSSTLIARQRDIDSVKHELKEELHKIRRLLKQPHLNYKDEIDYLIEVRNTQVKGLPDDWVKISTTKAVSRFLTPATLQLVEKLQYHKDMLVEEAKVEYQRFLRKLNNEYPMLRKIIANFATYDCLLALAATSCNTNYCRPQFTDSCQFIEAKNARNPIVESLDVNYVPNDVELSPTKGTAMVITGPNMGGKSSYIRQVALLVVMAQLGSYVPADQIQLSVFDTILTRIGAYDNILQGQSTFKIEMLEVLDIVRSSTSRSLVLLDEVGRGTSTDDGNAIASALLEYFTSGPDIPLVLFTTHYPFLNTMYSRHILHCYMEYVEKVAKNESWPSVVFLYKLRPGVTSSSYGLNVAKLAHIQNDIIEKAYMQSERLKAEYEVDASLRTPIYLASIVNNPNISAKEKMQSILGLASDD